MISITEVGKYKLTETVRMRASWSTFECPAGMEFTVTQIDERNGNFYSPAFEDWQNARSFPAVRIQ